MSAGECRHTCHLRPDTALDGISLRKINGMSATALVPANSR